MSPLHLVSLLALTHILVSFGQFYDRNAAAVIPVDADREAFFRDLAAWVTDENHFDDATSAAVPGYNIRIVVEVYVCFGIFPYPFCYAYQYELLNINVTLDDLGLGGFLNVQSKVSPGGQSAAQVAASISPKIHSDLAPQLADLGISHLNGTAAEKTYANNTLTPNLSEAQDPDVLVCVRFCGYAFSWGYDSYTLVTWVDIWRPIKKKLGIWGRMQLGIWAIILADKVNDALRQYRWVYHYTGPSGWAGISASGIIANRSQPFGGPVWLTPLAYPYGDMADELLALCGEPTVGYFAVRFDQARPGPLRTVDAKTCEPGSYMAGVFRKGGGKEQIAISPINAMPIRAFPVAPSMTPPN